MHSISGSSSVSQARPPLAALLAAGAVLLSLLSLAYYPTLREVFIVWSGAGDSSTYTHGFLVLGSALYLILARRDQLAMLRPQPSLLGLLPLAGASLLWFLARVVDVQLLQLAVLPVLLLSLVWAVYGPAVLRVVAVPIILLFFALPLWQPLLPLLQDITTFVSHKVLRLLGKSVLVMGHYVYLPGGSFVIEEACSGLRFLLIGTILTLVNSHLNRHTLRQGAALLGLVTLLAFVANWVRVVVVILIGDATRMQSPLVADHANLGWFIFLIFTLLPYILISRKVLPPRAAAAPAAVPKRNRGFVTGSLLAAALLVTGPALVLLLGQPESRKLTTDELSLTQGEWHRVPQATVDWRPQFLGGSSAVALAYHSEAGSRAELHLVYYGRQAQGAELINAANQLTDGERWLPVPGSSGRVALPAQLSGLENVHSIDIASTRSRKRVWYWYSVGGVDTTSPYEAKLLQVSSLIRRRADAALVALAVDCDTSCETASPVLQDFLLTLYPGLKQSLVSAQ